MWFSPNNGVRAWVFSLWKHHYDACIPAYSSDLNVNGPTLAGHCVNSLYLRGHEYNNGNVPACVRHYSLAVNANTTAQVSHRGIDIPGDFTGGLCDNSVYSIHDDDFNDRDSVPMSIDHTVLNESISSDHIPSDIIPYLDTLRTKYSRNIFIAHLNVSSIRYKFYEIHILNGNRIHINIWSLWDKYWHMFYRCSILYRRF